MLEVAKRPSRQKRSTLGLPSLLHSLSIKRHCRVVPAPCPVRNLLLYSESFVYDPHNQELRTPLCLLLQQLRSRGCRRSAEQVVGVLHALRLTLLNGEGQPLVCGLGLTSKGAEARLVETEVQEATTPVLQEKVEPPELPSTQEQSEQPTTDESAQRDEASEHRSDERDEDQGLNGEQNTTQTSSQHCTTTADPREVELHVAPPGPQGTTREAHPEEEKKAGPSHAKTPHHVAMLKLLEEFQGTLEAEVELGASAARISARLHAAALTHSDPSNVTLMCGARLMESYEHTLVHLLECTRELRNHLPRSNLTPSYIL